MSIAGSKKTTRRMVNGFLLQIEKRSSTGYTLFMEDHNVAL